MEVPPALPQLSPRPAHGGPQSSNSQWFTVTMRAPSLDGSAAALQGTPTSQAGSAGDLMVLVKTDSASMSLEDLLRRKTGAVPDRSQTVP